MGRAYTEAERSEIRVRILETGLAIFHENDAKSMNIREVAGRAGISLGGFYTFYPDKESFVLDVMLYRIRQKEDLVRAYFSVPSEDPEGQLAELILKGYLDIWHKVKTKKIYRDSMKLVTGASDQKKQAREKEVEQFVSDLAELWRQQGLRTQVDIKGVAGVIGMAGLMVLNGDQFPSPYFEELLRGMVQSGIHRYVKTSRTEGEKKYVCEGF